MNSAIYIGEVMHARLKPVKHSFRYPVFIYAFDLDELHDLDRRIPLFGYNRIRPVAIHDRDYLPGESGSIRSRLLEVLRTHGLQKEISRIVLVTAARFFNYVFNPVSFYYCFTPDEELACAVAEVNNTFGDSHLYILDQPRDSRPGCLAHYQAEKAFHVSPFNDMGGTYDVRFSDIRKNLDIRIDILRDGEPAFLTYIKGRPLPLTTSNLVRTLIRYPLSAALTMPRILWEAGKLYYRKGLPVYTRPNPTSTMTFRHARPGLRERLGKAAVIRFLSGLKTGCLQLRLPDGSTRRFGDPQSGPEAVLEVHNNAFFARAAFSGDIGFGESYTAGDWSSPDLVHLLRHFIANREHADDQNLLSAWAGRTLNRLRHLRRPNTVAGSRKNIRDHYDLGNDFFRTFLDPTMTYSGAYYLSPQDTLESAQTNKLRRMVRLARIQSTDHVLEIGSGWGSFAIEAVRQTGCKVTTITLSREQLALVRKRIQESGLSDKITAQFCDYRKMKGRFDKIVSIEMLEAVGHEHYGDYFATLDRLLKPNGLVALQVITIADQRYDSYRRGCDWIQKHVFPGAVVPSLTALSDAMTKNSRLLVESVDNIGYHYAWTLRDWRERLLANRKEIIRQGLDNSFIRKWDYYFAYCEAGFASRILNNLQIVLTRPHNTALMVEHPSLLEENHD